MKYLGERVGDKMVRETQKEGRLTGITIMRARDLPPNVRLENGLVDDFGFVEVRFSRDSPLKTEIKKIDGLPAQRLRSLVERKKLVGLKLF